MYKVENLKTGEWIMNEGRMTAGHFHVIVSSLIEALDYRKESDCVIGVVTSFGQYHGWIECRSQKADGGVIITVLRYIDVDGESVHATKLREYFQPIIPGFEWVHESLAGLGLQEV